MVIFIYVLQHKTMNNIYVFSLFHTKRNIPYIGHYIHEPLRDYLQQQKNSLHRSTNQMLETKVLDILFYVFIVIFIFVLFVCFYFRANHGSL